jgi:hypothetical protein
VKLQFTQEELRWLEHYMAGLLTMAHRNQEKDGGELMRLAAKVRHKIAPNAKTVYLGRKERALVARLASYRINNLIDQKQPTLT